MPREPDTELSGSAPDTHCTALLLIDVINPFDFDEADDLLRHALPAARRIAELRDKASAAGVPVIYVNDNFGKWRSDFRKVVEACEAEGMKGREIARLLRPGEDDYFVLKPMHSGFFHSALELLLRKLGARQLVLTGFAGNICVLYTASDAHMRDFEVFVPEDCCASNSAQDNDLVLEQMRKVFGATTAPSTALTPTAGGIRVEDGG